MEQPTKGSSRRPATGHKSAQGHAPTLHQAAPTAMTWDYDYSSGTFVLEASLAQVLGLGSEPPQIPFSRVQKALGRESGRGLQRALEAARREDGRVAVEIETAGGASARCLALYGRALRAQGQDSMRLSGVCEDVTERRREEAESREREAHFRSLADNVQDAIARFDLKCRFVYVNPAIERRSGRPKEEVLGKTNAEVGQPQDPEQLAAWQNALRRVVETGEEMLIEQPVTRPDGSYQLYQVRLTPERSEDGQIVSVLTLSRDISDLAAVSRALRERERLLSTTLRSIGDGVLSADTSGRITFLNPVAEALTGWSLGEAIGQPAESVFRILNEISREPVASPIEKVLAEGVIVALANHTVLLPRHGGEIPIDDSGAPVLDENGELCGAVLVFRDVTDRRRNEMARQRLAAIVQSSEDAIVATDLNGVVTDWNEAAERLYGYSAAEIIGRSKSLVMPPEMPDELGSILERIRHGERIAHYETVRLRKDGTRWNASISVAPVRNVYGEIVGASTIARNITLSVREMAAQTLLASASSLLASALDEETTLANIARMAVPELADWCTVHLIDESGDVRRIEIAHADPGRLAWAKELEGKYPYDPNAPRGLPRVLRTGEPEFYPDIPDEMVAELAQDEEHLRLIRALQVSAAIVAPMLVRGRTVGAITFISAESGKRYTEKDLALVQDLAQRAALAVESARLYKAARAHGARLEMLAKANQSINAVLEAPVIMRTLVSAAAELTDSTGGMWCLKDGSSLSTCECLRDGALVPASYTFGPGEGVPGWVLVTGAPYLTNDVPNDEHASHSRVKELGIRNLVNLPVLDATGAVIACFEVHNKQSGRRFDSNDLVLLQSLAACAATALANAELLQERTIHLQEISTLNERLRRSMRETHHRVRNNLQLIAALADLPVEEDSSVLPVEEFRRIGSQVRALAAVHDILTHQTGEEDGAIDLSSREVLEKLVALLRGTPQGSRIRARIEDMRLTARQATSLAIIANELVTNALKHGTGEVRLEFFVGQANAVLQVTDEGPGFPEEFEVGSSRSTGLQLVDHIAAWDLQARVSYGRAMNRSGGRVEVRMPVGSAANLSSPI